MKTAHWLVVVAIAGGTAYTAKGCLNRPAPDQKLAGQLEEMCEIARKGTADPVNGVKKYFGYLLDHAGDIMKNGADMVALIERIQDEEAHTERAIMARDRLNAVACHEDWQRFHDAIRANDDAMAIFEHTNARVQRTIRTIFLPYRDVFDLPKRLEELGAP